MFLAISSESPVCPPYYWFLFSLPLTLLSTISNEDFNSIICSLVFFLVLCIPFSIFPHSEPEVCLFSELSRSYISLFLSILPLCPIGFVSPGLIFCLYTLNKFTEKIRLGSQWRGNKIVTTQTETAVSYSLHPSGRRQMLLMVELCPPKKCWNPNPLIPQNVTSIQNRVTADMIS